MSFVQRASRGLTFAIPAKHNSTNIIVVMCLEVLLDVPQTLPPKNQGRRSLHVVPPTNAARPIHKKWPKQGRRQKRMKQNNQENQKPEKNFKVGAVRAAVWKRTYDTRDGRTFDARKVVLERSYRDSQGSWQNTNSYDLNDVPKAILALEQAYAYLTTKDQVGERANASAEVVEELG